jgi:exonuclease VII large subunit
MDVIKFTETIFTNNNKEGLVKPDENGYYIVILGVLNTYNSAGEYYIVESAL